MIKACINCLYVTDIYHVDTCWCLLSDDPVKYDESCGNWRPNKKEEIK